MAKVVSSPGSAAGPLSRSARSHLCALHVYAEFRCLFDQTRVSHAVHGQCRCLFDETRVSHALCEDVLGDKELTCKAGGRLGALAERRESRPGVIYRLVAGQLRVHCAGRTLTPSPPPAVHQIEPAPRQQVRMLAP